nr:proline-rich receptor-like protein kinase PERK8 [Aegilops tauschii subsp. strangulata]
MPRPPFLRRALDPAARCRTTVVAVTASPERFLTGLPPLRTSSPLSSSSLLPLPYTVREHLPLSPSASPVPATAPSRARTCCSSPIALCRAEEPPPLSPRPRVPVVRLRPPCCMSATAALPMLRPVAAAGAQRRSAGARAPQPPLVAQSGAPPRASAYSGCAR